MIDGFTPPNSPVLPSTLDGVSTATVNTPMESIGFIVSTMDSKTIFIFIGCFVLLSICIWLLFKFVGGMLYKKIEKWITDKKIRLNSGKLTIPGVGDVGFSAGDSPKPVITPLIEEEQQKEYLKEVVNNKGDILIFTGIFEDRTRKTIEKQNKKLEILMRYYESLEEHLTLKISDRLSDWLSLKLHITKDAVYDDDHYYYLVSMFENILNRIKIEWRSSFSKNGFEDVAEESEYVTEKTAILKSICKNHIQYSFKSAKLLKSELFLFIDELEFEFRNMNINLFQRARKESRISELVIQSWEAEVKAVRDNLLSDNSSPRGH